MAHTKAGGSTRLGRDSQSKRLGVKLYGGQTAKAGDIIVRQRGRRMLPGDGTMLAADYTIHAAKPGIVSFSTGKMARFTGQRVRRTVVTVK